MRLFLCLLFLLGASYLDAAAENINREINRRTAILLDVWSKIDRNFYDPAFNGVDWPSVKQRYSAAIPAAQTEPEFYKLIDQMLAELKSSHVSFQWPPEHRPKRGILAGVTVEQAGADFIITGVATNSRAARYIQRGDQILAVDGVPVETRARELAAILTTYVSIPTEQARAGLVQKLLFIGDAGTEAEVKLRSLKTEARVVRVLREVPGGQPTVESRLLEPGIGYLAFSAWVTPVDKEIESRVQEMKSVAALVLDLRRNAGGDDQPTSRIASLFFPEGTPWGVWRERSGREESFATGKAKLRYTGKLLVLIDENSASASENFAALVQETGRGIVIGRQSCGCLTATRWDKVKGGGKVGYPHRIPFTAKGARIEGVGIRPDVLISPSTEQLAAGEDPVLTAAIERAR